MANAPRPSAEELSRAVRMARQLLPTSIALQVPPNLADPLPLVESGANDLGGISPITQDGINPDRPWPAPEELAMRLKGYRLRERLPVYPRYVQRMWPGQKTLGLVAALAGEDGLRR